jgi:GntR family transcriptional regulator, transcriptional repressor for pyruvate dehydrogenase complex
MSTSATNPLQPVSRTSLVDEVIAAIRRMLAEEGWIAGMKLPSEQELSRQLGVGRSTVREALRVLGHLGLVEAKSGLGTFAAARDIPEGRVELPRTPEALRELYEFRRAIEVPCSRLAAELRTDEEFARIETAWRHCAGAVAQDSAAEFASRDYSFHLCIIEAAHNRFYLDAYRAIKRAFINYVDLILGLGPLHSMLHFHDGVIDAIRRHDADTAVRATEQNFVEIDVRLGMFMRGPAQANRP